MNDDVLRPIIKYAKTQENKAKALAAHRILMETDFVIYRGTDYYRFMHEIDNPVPDLLLRAMYRERISRVE